ncbi:carbon-nitrogen hydrolase family protein [Ancylomarina sp. 16SWW S1-10-2]|uniref:carbon-nitrogen hydrolase family protein n=1 Tax=Ancylomarina sp. 16SWW S1-10-2 TaxID=2499681 RepID=UPI0012AE1AA0|nr:bifunctional GNAT family N-acetyltransferase/carbon-nitrogen hydrolase family protein [Ancylomarina sp. 16SWW S1-10-2]MRT93950.1 GNAT family N-acetyltransferase [Ancylomarina sp. 16SWW S1-10-2]
MEGPLIELRHLQYEDYYSLKNVSIKAYSGIGGQFWSKDNLKNLLQLFPEGQICITSNGKVVACALSIIVDYNKIGENHTYKQVTGDYTFSTHTKTGDVLYGIEVLVHPEHRNKRLGRRLYDARKELCENLNLKSIIAGGRIPNYENYSDKLSPREYLENVRKREITDQVLSFQLANDFHVKKILKGYLPGDTESKEFATLLEWHNIYYQDNLRLINSEKKNVRLGIIQWQMRTFQNFETLVEQIEYFVDSLSRYKVDFILFPELFHAPLLANFDEMDESKAIRMLARYTESLREIFSDFSIKYNTNIIAGCLPCWEHDKLYSISYLCRRDGTFDSQYKIHTTPSESKFWGMNGGHDIKIFDTDCGKIGILPSYDIEFPEIARIQAEGNVQILFVPFVSDSKNSYYRIRRCAQSRAIENECYVAIAGCVGNLPKVTNMDIQYAQSAIFTPSDFAFPTDAILAQATPNTEMTLIADLDLDLLKQLHEFGNHKNLKNRRNDLYEIHLKKNKE